MPIIVKKDAWKIKDDNGVYRSADLFSTMLPSEARSLITETRTEFTNMEHEANEVLGNLVDAKQEILDLKVQIISEIEGTGTAQKNGITSHADTKKQEVTNKGFEQITAINDKGLEVLASIPNDYTTLVGTVDSIIRGGLIYDTASGNISSFDDGVDGMLIKSLVVNIEAQQNLHGYDHPWPGGAGVNICDEVFESGTINSYGNNQDNDTRIRTKNFIPVQPNTTYYIVAPNTLGIRFYNAEKTHLGASYNVTGQASSTFVTPQDAAYMRFFIMDVSEYANDVAINYPATVTTYSPYENDCEITGLTGTTIFHSGADTSNPDTLSVSWQSSVGPVFGGTVDVPVGKLIEEMAVVDLGTLEWVFQDGLPSGIMIYRVSKPDRKFGTNDDGIKGLCSKYVFGGNRTSSGHQNSLENGCFGFQSTNGGIYIRDDRYATVADFTAAMSGVQLVYPLSDPLEHTIASQQVSCLTGVNKIWADTGDVTVTYPVDTKTYIDRKIQEAIDGLSGS